MKQSGLIVLVSWLALGALSSAGGAEKTGQKTGEVQTAIIEEMPPALRSGYQVYINEGTSNRVLNAMRLGLDAMQLNYLEEAGRFFDIALSGIETVYANNETAAKARKMWYEEGSKDFKGEPYERAMAYYYRGVLYMLAGDYENAGVCFRGGMLQDAFAEEQVYRCDFAVLYFLEGWCWLRMKDRSKAEESFQELKKYRPDFQIPDPSINALFIIETGPSPRKLADGIGHAELKIFRGKGEKAVRTVIVIDENTNLSAYPMEDVAWQAQTRGGRQFDKILQGKAEFKQESAQTGAALSEAANNAMLTSSFMSGSQASTMQGLGAGLAVAGGIATIVSAKAIPKADTRYWDNLPETIHIVGAKLTPGAHQVKVKFMNQSGQEMLDLEKSLSIEAPETSEKIYYIRSPINLKYATQ